MIKYYKLFDVLQRRGLKKTDLIDKAGLTSPVLAKLSKGTNVNIDTINKICAALNVQPGDIMEFFPDDPEQKKE